MVALIKLLTAAFFLISNVSAFPALHPDDKALSNTSSLKEVYSIDDDSHFEKRQIGRQLLQWSPNGMVVYLMGTLGAYTTLPQELRDLIVGGVQKAPGQLLIHNLREFLITPPRTAMEGAMTLFYLGPANGQTRVGNLYAVGTRAMWGFAMVMEPGHTPNAADLADLVLAIRDWATQNGGRILVQQMPNGFFPSARIGAGVDKRSRTNTCPVSNLNMLKYASSEVPGDINYTREIRWSEVCSK